jgi:rod shape-determining protein MreD
MRWLVLVLLGLAHVSLGDLLRVGGIAPDLLLIGVVWAAAPSAPATGALAGFLAGLAYDLSGVDPLGASALAATSVGFFAARHLSPALKLHPARLTGRAFLILLPAEVFLANLRYQGLDYDPLALSLRLALPVTVYTLLLLGLALCIPRGAGRGEA